MNRSPRAFLFPYRNSGSILVISLWILVFFSILSVGLYKVVSAQVSLVKRVEERVLCEYLAKAAVIYAQDERANNKVSFYDSLYGLAQEKERELGIGEFVYTMTDEESKININFSSEEVIARLPGIDLDLAQRIISSPSRPFHVKEELLLLEGCDK
ncbi:MAG: hypothetical protein HQ547_05220, partial [Candidatus Omnitrophica bacterium]|nr:hypothetical protein [Candidatus Omnitrophota bacterium]